MKNIRIKGVEVGNGCKPFVVAELSANHNGSIERAKEIMLAAKQAGADAVKLQTYTPDTLTIDCDKDDFLIKTGPWSGMKLYDLYGEAYTPFSWHQALFSYAEEIGIICFSSPFDESAVDLLESLNCPAYKIASFEITDLTLIEYVAKTSKPMIISTGMANQSEILNAVNTAQSNGCNELILLHCISSYPAPVEQSNILTVPDISKRFNVLSGLSDHTLGTTVSVAAIALGACFIEKHFTISRQDKGPDSSFSLEPHEFKTLCEQAQDAWISLGTAGYDQKSAEMSNTVFRRSLYFVKDMNKGELISSENMRRIRPGFGLSASHYTNLLGKKVTRDIKQGERVSWNDVGIRE